MDGCALLDVPFTTSGKSQYITINVNLSAGVDLSDSVVTAHLRTLAGTTETIQLYASATNFAFWGNNNLTVQLSTLKNGGTLTMDLTNTPGWDNTKVISLGLLFAASTANPVQVLVEDVLVSVKADPQATPKAGPWQFTQAADVNAATAETVPTSYSVPNVIFANPYNAVTGAKPSWLPPSQ